jgi:hypothetical protein
MAGSRKENKAESGLSKIFNIDVREKICFL